MSTEVEIGKTAAKGILHIFSGKIVSRIIGVLGGIILMRLLADPSKYGLISVASIIPQILLLFTDLGIDTAMTKYIAENRAKGDFRSVKNLFFSGLLMKTAVMISLTVLCFALSTVFSTELLGKPYVSPLLAVASVLILGWGLSSFSEAVFMGFDATKIYSAFLVINEALLSFLPIILLLYGLDIFGVLVGMVVAVGITALLEAIACLVIIRRKSKETSPNNPKFSISFKDSFKKILVYGLPVQVVVLMGAGMGRFYHFLIASTCPDDQIGYFSTSERSYAFVDYVAWPIRLVLFPAFSKIDYTSRPESLKKTLKYSVKYSSLIILPLIVLVAVLAHPLVVVLFGVEYEYAWVYLFLLSLSGLAYGCGSAHFHKLFMAQGETRFIAKLEALSALIGIALAVILIPQFKIFGYIVLDVSLVWPAYFLMIRKARKDYGVSVPLGAVWKIYVATIITGIVVFFSSSLVANDLLKLVIGGLMGLAVYVLTLLIISGVNLTDIENLREMVKDQPIVGSLFRKLLDLVEKIYLRFHPDATT